MPVRHYLDLSTSHLTEAEMGAVSDRLADLDENTPRIIAHEYGAWVNVQEGENGPELSDHYPNLAACIDLARAKGCDWINFDQDADIEPPTRAYRAGPLPTFDW